MGPNQCVFFLAQMEVRGKCILIRMAGSSVGT